MTSQYVDPITQTTAYIDPFTMMSDIEPAADENIGRDSFKPHYNL